MAHRGDKEAGLTQTRFWMRKQSLPGSCNHRPTLHMGLGFKFSPLLWSRNPDFKKLTLKKK